MTLKIRTLAGCATAATATALLLAAPAASAGPAQTDKFETVVFDFNTCNGEFVQTQGTAHFVIKTNPDGSIDEKVQYHGDGTGSLGNDYVLNLNEKLTFAPNSFDQKARINTVSKGAAPNQAIVVIATLHPDGTFDSSFTTECRGS